MKQKRENSQIAAQEKMRCQKPKSVRTPFFLLHIKAITKILLKTSRFPAGLKSNSNLISHWQEVKKHLKENRTDQFNFFEF